MANNDHNLGITLLFELYRISRFVRLLEGSAKKYGLTSGQFNTLFILDRAGELPIKKLIEYQRTTSGNITVILKNLYDRGLVRKRENPDDRRSVLISLSDEGKQLLDSILPEHLEYCKKTIENLKPEEMQTLHKILKKVGTGQE